MNRQQTAIVWIVGLIVFVVALIWLVSLGNIKTGNDNPLLVAGDIPGCTSSVLSIDKVSITNDLSGWDNDVYQLTLSGREAGQCIYGYLDSNELAQQIGNAIGKEVKTKYSNPFAITLKRTESNAYYKIDQISAPGVVSKYKYTPTGSPIGTYLTKLDCKTGIPWVSDSCGTKCKNAGYDQSNCEAFAGIVAGKCYCFSYATIGNNYRYNTDRLQEKVSVNVTTGDGVTSLVDLDTDVNGDSTSKVLRDGLYSSFEGYLQGPKLLPAPTGFVFYSNGVRSVITGATDLTVNPQCQNQVYFDKVESCMMQYNTKTDRALVPAPEFSTATVDSNYVKLPLSKDTYYPVIKVQVRAKWLGIYEPIAEPVLSQCQGVELEFTNKKEGYATYTLGIKPGSGDQGTFAMSAVCSGTGFSATPMQMSQTVVGTQTVNGMIRILQTNNVDSSTSCTIKATLNRLTGTKETTCGITVTGQSACATESQPCGVAGCCEGLKCGSTGYCERVPGVEICYDRIDNDANGLVDCFDPKCSESIYCGGPDNSTCKLTTCEECGTGLLNTCDQAECNACANTLNCTFVPGTISNKCVSPDKTCKTCWAWLNAKTLKPGSCESAVLKEGKWYNPTTWVWYMTGQITQDFVCPIILIVYLILALVVGAVVYLLVVIIMKTTKGVKRK